MLRESSFYSQLRLKIFSGKLKTRWSGPFTITKVFPYGTIELSQPDGPNFKVNGHRVKHYFGGTLAQRDQISTLSLRTNEFRDRDEPKFSEDSRVKTKGKAKLRVKEGNSSTQVHLGVKNVIKRTILANPKNDTVANEESTKLMGFTLDSLTMKAQGDQLWKSSIGLYVAYL
ncbi:hypothetical protein Tco_1569229 [Tanacetum coccineum]